MNLEGGARGRSEMWYLQEKAAAQCLLGRHDAAIESMQRAFALGFGYHNAWYFLRHDLACQAIMDRPEVEALRERSRVRVARERAALGRVDPS
jgi:hypothetical protein